nr:Chain A, Evasin P991 [Amblyomma cajennense]8FK9_B Chain B, Evasin P991 [Amblyomma cajennense]
ENGEGTTQPDYDNSTDYYNYEDFKCTCPAPHLNNTNGTVMKPIGCYYTCNVTRCTAPDTYPCYNLTEHQAKNLTTSPTTLCAVGNCDHGICVPNGTKELCFKAPNLEE